MGDRSKIDWTDATWNPVRGCSVVSPGCVNCYAMTMAHRFSAPGKPYEGLTKLGNRGPVWTGDVMLVDDALDQPLRWQRPRMIFVNSMSDLFHERVPDEFIRRVWTVMRKAERHTFQILTKRTARAREFMVDHPAPPNAWVGASIEDQKRCDERLRDVSMFNAEVRCVSAEPLIGPVEFDFESWPVDWVIVGGESGPRARVCEPEWIESIVDECERYLIPVFVKQLGAVTASQRRFEHRKGGEPSEWPESLRVREYPRLRPF